MKDINKRKSIQHAKLITELCISAVIMLSAGYIVYKGTSRTRIVEKSPLVELDSTDELSTPDDTIDENKVIFQNIEVSTKDKFKGDLILVNNDHQYFSGGEDLVGVSEQFDNDGVDFIVGNDYNVQLRKTPLLALEQMARDFYAAKNINDLIVISGLTLLKTPLILIFSLFIAVILNQKFKGRSLARAIFFLPVIIATGPVFSIINGDISNTGNTSAGQFSTMFSSNLVDKLMHFLGIYNFSDKITDYITVISNDIFGIVWNAGIQILIFLAALQNIPASAREAAAIEGATSWEYFWKITVPYVSPFILANFIFTVIDTFSSPVNEVMQRITKIQSDLNFGLAAAMAWIYFIVALSGIMVVTVIMRHYIYYETD